MPVYLNWKGCIQYRLGSLFFYHVVPGFAHSRVFGTHENFACFDFVEGVGFDAEEFCCLEDDAFKAFSASTSTTWSGAESPTPGRALTAGLEAATTHYCPTNQTQIRAARDFFLAGGSWRLSGGGLGELRGVGCVSTSRLTVSLATTLGAWVLRCFWAGFLATGFFATGFFATGFLVAGFFAGAFLAAGFLVVLASRCLATGLRGLVVALVPGFGFS